MHAKKLFFFLQFTAEIKPRTFLSNLNRTKVNSKNQDQAIVDWNITKSLGVECHQKLWKGWRAFPKIVLRLFPQFPHATTRLFLHVELLLLSWKPGEMKTISELFHGMLCYIYTESESHACYWTQVLWSRFLLKISNWSLVEKFEIEMLPSLIIDILISRRNISFGKNNEPLGPWCPQQWFCVQSTSDFHWISNF